MSDPTKAAKTGSHRVLGSGYEDRIAELKAELIICRIDQFLKAALDALRVIELDRSIEKFRQSQEPRECFRHDGVDCPTPTSTCKGCKIFSKG